MSSLDDPVPRLLIADYAPTRLGIRMALGGAVHVCAEAGTAAEAIRAAERHQPDICIVGRDIPGDGIAATRGICVAAPEAAVVVLTDALDPDDLTAALQGGAIGYLPGSISAAALRQVMASVLKQEAAIPRSMVLELVRQLRGTAALRENGLSARESQVLELLRRGQSTSAIARQLGISPVTVRRHISTAVQKSGYSSRGALTGVPQSPGGPVSASARN